MSNWTILSSYQDQSVNHIKPTDDKGFFEARFVRRVDDYFICYLSSHTGCDYSCKFCHLTATKQTMMTQASLSDYLEQADRVLSTYRQRSSQGSSIAQRINFNFMARGEPLANDVVLKNSQELFDSLSEKAHEVGLPCKFNISTIIPRDFDGDLSVIMKDPKATPYYSLYSVDPKFRKKWLGKAKPAFEALQMLGEYQKKTGGKIVLHWAFIEGENDREEQVLETLDTVESFGIKAKFNLVRYNPHDSRHGCEPSEEKLQKLFSIVNARMDCEGSRIVPRVGPDVKASCGMFVTGQ